jgi:hypothetical protein
MSLGYFLRSVSDLAEALAMEDIDEPVVISVGPKTFKHVLECSKKFLNYSEDGTGSDCQILQFNLGPTIAVMEAK